MRAANSYLLGRRQVPIDVCRVRRRVVAPSRRPPKRVVVEPSAARPDSGAVPSAVAREQETTGPITLDDVRGPDHADLRALGRGDFDELTLAGRYRLDRRLGQGGMATVYRARLLSLGRPVALKVLDDERGHRDDGLSRFLAEARTTARIRHPNVVEVLDFGSTQEGVIYMVMELLEGEDLRTLSKREGPMPWPQVRDIMLQICAGLAAAHAAGVVHRDLKPANCVRTREGVKLVDFGISTQLGPRERDARRLTEEGRVVGTPEYMSPEQARGDEVDARSDVYAAGIILAELLTGRVPFEAKSASTVIAAHIYEQPPSLEALAGRTDIDPALEAIYARALSKDPNDRFESITAFAEALASVPDEPIAECSSWWRPGRLLAAAGLLAASLAGWLM